MERRKFLQNTCPTVTFAFFGLSYIRACSKSDDGDSYSSNSSSRSKSKRSSNCMRIYRLWIRNRRASWSMRKSRKWRAEVQAEVEPIGVVDEQ